MYPFVVNMSCLTGYFIYPKAGAYAASSWRSLAEGWMGSEDAGAVAALMPRHDRRWRPAHLVNAL
jgi:hypothetical protein